MRRPDAGARFRARTRRHVLRGDLASDAHLVVLAIEHGLCACSADTDFARFREVEWLNPLRRR